MEMLIVVGIIGVMLPVFFSIVFLIVRQQLSLGQLQRVKEAGDFAEKRISSIVRNNTLDVDPTCADPALPAEFAGASIKVCFKDIYNNPFGFYIDDQGRLASHSALISSPAYFISGTDEDFPLTAEIRAGNDGFTINNKIVKFSYSVVYTPTVDYMSSQSLSYQYYVYIRR